MEPPNGARIKCFGSGLPVTDIAEVDSVQMIWRGTRIVEPGTPADIMTVVYFSRRYDRENSDLDRMLTEYDFLDGRDILGVPFIVIPKEKLIFGLDEPSAVIVRLPAPRRQPGPLDQL